MTMKNCKKIKELMPDAVNKTLPEEEQKSFQAHLENCARCSGEYKEVEALLSLMNRRHRPEMNEDYWDNFSLRLEEKIDAEEETAKPQTTALTNTWRQRWQTWLGGIDFRLKWVLYPAAVAAMVVVGVGISRYISLPSGKEFINTAVSSVRQLSPAVAAHFDNVQPLLVDYANYTPEENETEPEEPVMMDKSTVQKLLLENRLLKRVVAKSNNLSAKQVIEELDVILVELTNSDGDNKEITRAVQQIIKDNDILFKMKVLCKKDKSTPTI
ncbi:MAG: zf-HC2 domain-containing protein [bacterium]|nr:zf-HC2 domain-containing protein [bacterium]